MAFSPRLSCRHKTKTEIRNERSRRHARLAQFVAGLGLAAGTALAKKIHGELVVVRSASSRDTSGLGLDSCAQARSQCRTGHQVRLHSEAVLEEELQAHEPIEGRRSNEVHEDVEIAGFRGFAARHRPKHGKLANAEGARAAGNSSASRARARARSTPHIIRLQHDDDEPEREGRTRATRGAPFAHY